MPISQISEKEFFTLIENIITPERNNKAISFLKSLHKIKGYEERGKRELLAHPFLATKANFKGYIIKIPKAVIEDGYIKEFDIQLSRKNTLFKSLFNSTKKIINPLLSLLKKNSEIKHFDWHYDTLDGIATHYFSKQERDSYSDEVDFIYFLYNEKNSKGQAELPPDYLPSDYRRDFIIFQYNYPYYFTGK